jgi:hypothetical protein
MPSTNRARLVRVLYAFVLAACAPSARAACTGFGAAAGIGAASSPQTVVSADFDRDGIADLAVACGTGASLEILRGLPGGAFAPPVAYASGTAGRALAVGDFDGNSAPDLAVCVSTGVAIWYGRGDGTFAGGAILSLGSSPRGVVCADFDEDGIQDLAVASANTNSVLIARGGGANGVPDGTFGAGASFAAGTSPVRLVAADFDADGILDLACANNSSANVSFLRGLGAHAHGNGAFAPAVNVSVAGSPWGLAVIDADRDGDPDVLASNGAGTTIAWLRNAGGVFANVATFTTLTAPRDLVVGDFDGDGLADVAAACAVGNNVAVLRGNGAGGFGALGNFATGSGAAGLVAGDWNGDGAPDLVVANSGAGTLSRLLGTCPAAAGSGVAVLAPNGGDAWWPGMEQQVRWAAGGSVGVVNVDVSRDGGATWRPLARGATGDHAGVPAIGAPSAALRVRVSDALVPARADASDAPFTLCGLFGAPRGSAAGLAATHLASADLDGDGLTDLVACGGGLARVLRGTGDGHFAAGDAFAVEAPSRVRLADATGDALTDLVTLGATGLSVRAGDGAGGFGPASVLPLAGGADFAPGDFDEDGALDFAVLLAEGAGSRLAVLGGEGGEGGAWTMRSSTAIDGTPARLECADLGGDGIADLAVETGTLLQVWAGGGAAGRGDGTFTLASERTLLAAGGDLVVGDTDGDARLDIGVCVPSTGDLWTFANGTTEASLAPQLDAPVAAAAGGTPASPAFADFDGDGLADLVVALADSGRVAVLPGVPGGFGPAIPFPGGGGALVVGDFTGDGTADVVVVAGDSVVCLPSMCGPKLAATVALARRDEPPAIVGFERTFAWTRTAPVALARVELSRDGGAHWTALAEAVAADRLAWTVTGPATGAARLRVADASVPGRFDETASFAIREAFGTPGASAALAGSRLATGDLDGDAFADAAVTDGATVQVLRGIGLQGGFTEVARFAAPGVRQVLLADVDRDGLADVVTLSGGYLALHRRLADGSFDEPLIVPIDSGDAGLVVGDFDEDGTPDMALASSNGVANRVSVLRGFGVPGAPEFVPLTNAALPAAPAAIATGDWNGDGIADLAVTHAAGLSVLLGNGAGGRGDGTFRVTSTRAFGAGSLRGLLACDADGDGAPDLVAPDSAAHAVWITRGDGAGGFGPPVSFAVPLAPRALSPADVDGDGHLDFAIAGDAGTCLLRGTGAIAAGAFAAAAWLPAAAALASRDADGDGIADLLLLGGGALSVAPGGTAPAAPAPHLLTPNGSERPRPGDELLVRWAASGAPVDLDLSRDGGERWERLATNLPGTSFRWTVTGPVTGLARLRVRESAIPARADTSDAPFQIEPTALDATPLAPVALALSPPWPNPARGVVSLALTLPQSVQVTAEVLDIAGRRVRTLHQGALAAGAHSLRWNGTTDNGDTSPAGIYFVRIRLDGYELARPVTLVR